MCVLHTLFVDAYGHLAACLTSTRNNHFTSSSDCGYTNSSLSSARCCVVLRINAATIPPNLVFRRLPGLQLLFFLCQILILPRKNCALAISNLIVRNLSNAIAITSTLHFMCVICPGPHYSMPFTLELCCCLYVHFMVDILPLPLINHPFHYHYRPGVYPHDVPPSLQQVPLSHRHLPIPPGLHQHQHQQIKWRD